ncbi:MAG: hypothetical protein BroJett012_17990 [Betaproteobacteria bacterium]|nr:MAG: hypothetical protein BroJett012_17990 [Betaproteobacteria bacterium]
MLGIFSAKSGHPLADAKEAKRVLNELSVREAATALDEVAGWLESVAADEAFRLADRLALVSQLDEAVQAHERKLGRDYLTSPRLGRQQEYKLWQANHDYWQQLGNAYDACLTRYRSQEKGSDAVKSGLPQLLIRLLRALSAQLKWDQFRYGPVNGELWQRMGRAYLFAEQGKLSRQSLTPYPNVPGDSTVEQEYLKALVFQASSMDSLLPLEIEIAERIIAHFLPQFVFTAEARPDNVYWVDADQPAPPKRLAVQPQIAPSLRFFSAGAALEKLEAMLRQVERGEVPSEVNLGAQYSARIMLPVLRHLAMYWAPKPPMRSHDRHRVKSRLTAVNGLAAVHDRLSNRGDEQSEAWVVDDVSLGGMGAQVPLGANDWVRIGALLGMQPEGGSNWLVGVIRRFSRETPTQGSVGIETLSKSPQAIAGDLGGMDCNAILLDTLHTGDTVRVVLPSAAFEPAIPLVFAWQGRSARLDPIEQLESGVDFDLGLYRVAPPG